MIKSIFDSLYKSWWQYWQEDGYSRKTSTIVAEKIVSSAEIGKNMTIVELGSGNGSITKAIIRRIQPTNHLILVEINEHHIKTLRELIKGYDNIELIHDGAEDIINTIGYGKVDIVISSLPLGSLRQEMNVKIIEGVREILKPGGKYLQYQYWPKQKGLIKTIFGNIKMHLDIRNIPPVFIYETRK